MLSKLRHNHGGSEPQWRLKKGGGWHHQIAFQDNRFGGKVVTVWTIELLEAWRPVRD